MRRLTFGLVLAAGLLAGCQGDPISNAQDAAKDKAARTEYFETAALTYYDGGRYDLAETQFRRVLGVEPENKRAKRGLAKTLYMQAATPNLNRMQRAAKLREAQGLLEEVVPLEWPNPGGQGSRRYEVQTDLALVYSDLGDLYDRDVRDLQHSLRTDPGARDSQYSGTIDIQVSKRNALLKRAIPIFHTVLRASPDNPYAMAGLAKANLQLGNDAEGIEWAHRYLVLSQRSQVLWKEELDRYTQAVKGQVTRAQRKHIIDKVQGAREKEKKMHLMLASVYMRRGAFSKATKEYSDVLRIDSSVPAAYLERAQAFAAMQQYQRAVDDLEEYLKITDPQMHRQQRLSAVELLDRYQGASARRGAPPVRATGGSNPASPPWGSPDR